MGEERRSSKRKKRAGKRRLSSKRSEKREGRGLPILTLRPSWPVRSGSSMGRRGKGLMGHREETERFTVYRSKKEGISENRAVEGD